MIDNVCDSSVSVTVYCFDSKPVLVVDLSGHNSYCVERVLNWLEHREDAEESPLESLPGYCSLLLFS